MAKQLVIDLKAIDNVSPAVRAAIGSMLLAGDAAVKTETKASGAFGKIFKSVVSLQGAIVGLVGAITVRGVVDSLAGAAKEMEHIADEGDRLGMTAEQISSLKYTADIANVSFEALAKGIFTAERNIGEFATTGRGRAGPALRSLGVELRSANGQVRAMSELLPELVDALNNIPDTNERNFLASKIFGGGAEFIKLLREGGDRLRAMNQEARALGVVFSPEQLRTATEFRDSLDRVKQAWFGLRAAVVVEGGPAMTRTLNSLSSGIAAVPEMTRNVMRDLGAALDGDARAKDKFAAWFESLGAVAVSGLKVAGNTALVGGLMVLDFVIDKIFGTSRERISAGVAGLKVNIAQEIVDVFQSFTTIAPALKEPLATAQAALDLFRPELESTSGKVLTAAQAGQQLQGSWAEMAATIAESNAPLLAVLNADSKAFAENTDKILGWKSAIEKTRIVAQSRSGMRAGGMPAAVSLEQNWLNGLSQGLDDFREKSRQTYELGRQGFNSMAESGVDRLSVALVDAAGNVKNLGRNMKQWGSDSLRMLSELITKFLILRGVSGIAGAFASTGGGGGSLPPDAFSGASGVNRGGIIGMARGGLVPVMLTPGERGFEPGSFSPSMLARANSGMRVPGFGGGGFVVPGPNIDRDIVPAMLPPGTGILSRRGVAAQGFAGGGVVVGHAGADGGMAMGNVSITIHQSGQVTGGAGGVGGGGGSGGGDPDRVLAAALVRVIQTRPQVRSFMREMLRG